MIALWIDGTGRLWADTGRMSPRTQEIIVQLLNGAEQGPWSEIDARVDGGLKKLGKTESYSPTRG